MVTGAIICARLNSTRLPGKMLADIGGETMLWHIVDRLKACDLLNEIIVATTTEDNELADYCKSEAIKCFQGDEQDILGRVYGAAKEYNLDVVVRVWGDCPLPSPVLIDKIITEFNKNSFQYLYTENYPKGQNIAIMPIGLLGTWNRNLPNEENRHWFHTWCTSKPWASKIVSPIDYSKVNLCVDTQEDGGKIREGMEPSILKIGRRRFVEYWPAKEVEVVND